MEFDAPPPLVGAPLPCMHGRATSDNPGLRCRSGWMAFVPVRNLEAAGGALWHSGLHLQCNRTREIGGSGEARCGRVEA
jgi:hypothetical protein